jgi:methionyl aminopeptidase
MVFTIEPMINAGGPETRTLADQWTVATADGKRSAQFEHSLAITEQGPELLTVL